MAKITDLKTDNIHQIRICFYNGEIWTKNDLAKHAGLSLAATTNTLQLLLKDSEIELVGKAPSTGGRKSKQYIINRDYCHLGTVILKRDEQSHYFITKSSDLLGQVLEEKRYISKQGTLTELFDVIAELINKDAKITVLALSIPGVCANGKIGICDFDQLSNISLVEILEERFSIKVIIENDVNVASIGFSKRYLDAGNLALLYQPRVKYVGCGILVNHQLCRGFSNFAGELSYLPFYTHRQQREMLQSDPNHLLMQQLVTVCCVIDPQIVAICSDVLDEFDSTSLTNYLPVEHCPKIVVIKELDQLIYEGLSLLAIEVLKNKRKREN